MYRTKDDDLIAEYSPKIPHKQKEGGYSWEKEKDTPEEWVKVEVPYSVLYPTIEEYVETYGYTYFDGKPGYWYNKNAKWDWWVVGGRWDGCFDGTNVINVKDYDISINIEIYNARYNEWKEWEAGKEFSFDENYDFAFYKPEYLKVFIRMQKLMPVLKLLHGCGQSLLLMVSGTKSVKWAGGDVLMKLERICSIG